MRGRPGFRPRRPYRPFMRPYRRGLWWRRPFLRRPFGGLVWFILPALACGGFFLLATVMRLFLR